MIRTLVTTALLVGFLCAACPVFGDSFPVILSGKVTLADGSAPPVSVGVERVCSDNQGSASGPPTNKKGEFVWRLDIDPLASRACYLRATAPGWESTTVDVSALPGLTNANLKLDPIVIRPKGVDPEQITNNESTIPVKALPGWRGAMKALEANNYPDAIKELQASVQAAPKFAQGWQTLGIILNAQRKDADARDAFEHAVAADPKYIAGYVSLARECIRTKDWDAASKAADAGIKADTKHMYLENYLHQAVARYEAKDLDGAIAAAQQGVMLDKTHVVPRMEYVWGRALEAKGDLDGARQHMTHYLELDKAAADLSQVKTHLDNLGKPGVMEPKLELL